MEAIHGEHRFFERDEHRGASFVLALAMHLLLALFLVISVRWQTKRVQTVEVELWGSPPPEQVVVPQPKVEQPKVETPPEPIPEKKPEIVEEKVKPQPKPVEKPKPQPASPVKAKPAEPTLADLLNKGMEQRNKAADVPVLGKPGGTGTNPKVLTNNGPGTGSGGGGRPGDDYLGSVVRLIKSNMGYPATSPDNPKAKIKVMLLPDGTIRDAQIQKIVGDPAYAEAAKRAVMTTQRFPPQPDGKLFSGDMREWTLSFCAKENVECKID